MKRSDIYVLCLLVVIVSFSFLSIKNNVVIGQDTSSSSSSSSGNVSSSSSSSSSSSGDVSTSSSSGDASTSSSSSSGIVVSTSSSGSSSIVLNKNFTGHWKAKIEKPCVVCTQEVPSCSSGQVVALSSCMECAHCVNAIVSSSSSGSVVSREFLAHLASDVPGSRVLTFKLCVKDDGTLEGTVHQGGVFLNGMITEQTIISADEVEFTVESQDGKTARIHLKLTAEREFAGTFVDGHEFIGRKLNPNRQCLHKPGSTTSGGPPSMGDPGMGFPSMGSPGMSDFGMSDDDGPGMSGFGMSDDDSPGMSDFGMSGGSDMSGFPGMGDFPGMT